MIHSSLELKVKANQLDWSWLQQRRGRDVPNHENGFVDLEIPDLQRQTLKSLVWLQRLLTDALAEDRLPKATRREVEEELPRLTKTLGESLYELLFPKPVHEALNKLIEDLPEEGHLRVELEFDCEAPDDLVTWPWEYLRVPVGKGRAGGQWLARVARLVFVRRLNLAGRDPEEIPPPLKVLLVVPRPITKGLGSVLYKETLQVLNDLDASKSIVLIQALIEPDFVMGKTYEPTASWERFTQIVAKEKPHVIHFIGHGQRGEEQGELAFVKDGCEVHWIKNFAEGVTCDPNLKLVFLQACESALPDPRAPMSSVAQQLAMLNIPAVVAMQAKVTNEDAALFAREFYKAIAACESVDLAVRCGREAVAIRASGNDSFAGLAFGIPVLYSKYQGPLLGVQTITAGKPAQERGEQALHEWNACPNCKLTIKTSHRKCPFCALLLVCPTCGTPRYALEQKFCTGNCDFEFPPPAGPGVPQGTTLRTSGDAQASAQRVTLATQFSKEVGSSAESVLSGQRLTHGIEVGSLQTVNGP